MKRITTIDPVRTVALLLSYRNAGLLIYGTVLPWHSDFGDAHADPRPRNWQEHRRVVEEQTQEWQALRAQFPDAFLAIAGDWNSDLLAGSGLARRSYGPTAEAKRLVESLDELGLQVPTRNVPDPGGQRPRLIDHIAVPRGETSVDVVPAIGSDAKTLSDHPLVSVDWCTHCV